jgi:UDP-galactose transporter B1
MVAPSIQGRTTLGNIGLLLFCVIGIYSAYLTQGIKSEDLQLKKYGATGERFRNLEALNGAQSLCAFMFAWIILQVGRS